MTMSLVRSESGCRQVVMSPWIRCPRASEAFKARLTSDLIRLQLVWLEQCQNNPELLKQRVMGRTP